MYCMYCGFELRDNAKFCDNCGKSVKKPELSQDSFFIDDELKDEEIKPAEPPKYKYAWAVILASVVLFILLIVKATDYYSKQAPVDIENDYVSDVETEAFYNTEELTEETESMDKLTNKQTTEKTVIDVPTEYLNALTKAETYSEYMHMSKKSIYDQLVSEYGENFPEDAAQYAIDNLVADWNANALEKAKIYYEDMSMSKSAVYEQLISEYGEQFTESEAQYAIDHLE